MSVMHTPEAPLAERMRPKIPRGLCGTNAPVGADATLRRALSAGQLPSMILWGPPGSGKTTLARLMAEATGRPFHQLSAIRSGVKEVREVIDSAERQGMFSTRAVLFIDEIHRFSKSQQDSLLGAVERGSVTLIGATTENPSFEVIPALLSRSQVYVLEALDGSSWKPWCTGPWRRMTGCRSTSGGGEWDACCGQRRRWPASAQCAGARGGGRAPPSRWKRAHGHRRRLVSRFVQANLSRYDKTGDTHYDIASALIKSIRSSDPDGAVYWLARMIEGGRTPSSSPGVCSSRQ